MEEKDSEIVVAEIKKDIEYIKISLDEGFKGIHKRQDIANGTLIKHEKQLIKFGIMINNKADKKDLNDYEKETLKKELSWKTRFVSCAITAGITALVILILGNSDLILSKIF